MNAEKINIQQQADTIINYLNSVCSKNKLMFLAATEVNLKYQIGVIRTKSVTLDLINPEIISLEKPFISIGETCASNFQKHNCLRYKLITIRNGIGRYEVELKGKTAVMAQQLIDHINGINISKRTVRTAIVRKGGAINASAMCLCGSRLPFKGCCGTKGCPTIGQEQKNK